MRRLIIEEPVSRPAKWSPTLAWFALVVTVFAVLLIRFNRIDYQAGFIALGAGIAIALLAVAMSFLGFVRIWQEGRQGLGSAIRGLFLAGLVLAYPGFMALKAATLPPIADISTDTDDPPAFSRSRAALQARDGRVPPDVPREAREMQRASYVQIAPLTLDIGPDEAFAIVQKAAQNLGWQVIEAVPPGGRVGLGRLEAVDRSRRCGSARASTARASTSARPPASAATIWAPMRGISATSSRKPRTWRSRCVNGRFPLTSWPGSSRPSRLSRSPRLPSSGAPAQGR
jgi:hypothetical protein